MHDRCGALENDSTLNLNNANLQSGNWVLELEGCCRVKVNSAHSNSDGHYTAAVEQLEHFRDAHARQALHCGRWLGRKLSDCKPGSHADMYVYTGSTRQAVQADAGSDAALLEPCRQEADELDAEGEAALAQLRQAARQLLGMVSLTSGPAAAARLADVSFVQCWPTHGSVMMVHHSAFNCLRSEISCHHRMSSMK